ncbi:MAG: hypothetical protein R2838_25795 [Caldilineaceae bacterium]
MLIDLIMRDMDRAGCHQRPYQDRLHAARYLARLDAELARTAIRVAATAAPIRPPLDLFGAGLTAPRPRTTMISPLRRSLNHVTMPRDASDRASFFCDLPMTIDCETDNLTQPSLPPKPGYAAETGAAAQRHTASTGLTSPPLW